MIKGSPMLHLGPIWYHSEPSDVPYSQNLPRPISWIGLFVQLYDSSLRNRSRSQVYQFQFFFQALQPYWCVHLFFLPNFPGLTFIPYSVLHLRRLEHVIFCAIWIFSGNGARGSLNGKSKKKRIFIIANIFFVISRFFYNRKIGFSNMYKVQGGLNV